jgi:hypothetical protein
MDELINLTPHSIRIYHPDTESRITDPDDGLLIEIPPSGTVARLATIDLGTWGIAYHEGVHIPVEGVEYGHPEGLPPETMADIRYVVSLAFALAMPYRDDLLVPYVEVRSTEGVMLGCKFLARVAG